MDQTCNLVILLMDLSEWEVLEISEIQLEAFGKPPNVAKVFHKAYLRVDVLKQLGSSTTNEEEGKGSQPGIIVYPNARRVISFHGEHDSLLLNSADCQRYMQLNGSFRPISILWRSITAGSNESTRTLTQTVLKVFGRTKRLGLDSPGPSKQRSRWSSGSSNKEFEVV